MNSKVLLVDDEKDIVEFLQYNLEAENFKVITAYDGLEAVERMDENPDLVILDISMPKMNGYEACEKIRQEKKFDNIPIIFLTARTSEVDELKGLHCGADDYIKKPISPKVLVARVKAKLKRKSIITHSDDAETNILKIGPLQINKDKHEVLLEGKKIILPKKEFSILYYLAGKPGKVFPRNRILDDVWGDDIFVIERTVDVHVRKIREKFGKHSNLIETIKGVGYRFKEH